MKKRNTKSILKLAGAWKISDKELKNIKKDLRAGWKNWKMPEASF